MFTLQVRSLKYLASICKKHDRDILAKRERVYPMSPYIWLGIAALTAGAEIVSFNLITVWFTAGALVTFIVSLFSSSILLQIIVFLVVSVGCLLALRPVFVKYRDRGKQAESTHIGDIAVVCESIDNNRLVGRIETPDHITWMARSADGSVIPAGANVVVIGQESVKLIVERKLS